MGPLRRAMSFPYPTLAHTDRQAETEHGHSKSVILELIQEFILLNLHIQQK